jgi:hypothetical protein
MLVDRVSFPTEVPPPEPRLENATARHVISEGHAEEGVKIRFTVPRLAAPCSAETDFLASREPDNFFRDAPLLINDLDSSMHAICATRIMSALGCYSCFPVRLKVIADYKCIRICGDGKEWRHGPRV